VEAVAFWTLGTLSLLRELVAVRLVRHRWLDLLPVAAALAALLHARSALRTSSFILVFALPAYGVAGLQLLATLPRLWRGYRAPAGWSGALRRATAVVGLVVLGFAADRVRRFEARRAALPRFSAVRAEHREHDLSSRTWAEAFDGLFAVLEAEYPFSDWKAIDWKAMAAEYRPRVAVAEGTRDRRAYYRVLRELAWRIPDGHVGLAGDDSGLEAAEVGGGYGLALHQLEDGRLVAGRVSPLSPAARAGIQAGAELVSWNGLAAQQALEGAAILWSEEPPATREGRRRLQERFLARAPIGAVATVEYRNPGWASARRATLTAIEAPDSGGRAIEAFPAVLLGCAVETRRLPEGFGYIRVLFELPTPRCPEPDRVLAAAVAEWSRAGVAGLVLDVRGNVGGMDALVPLLLAPFSDRAGTYEIPGVLDHAAGRFLPVPADAVPLARVPERFAGRVVVLQDGQTISSGEGLPLVLKGQANVTVVGFEGTHGSFAINQKQVRLPEGLSFAFPQARSLGPDGRIQVDSDGAGRGGVEPDVRLPLDAATVEALAQGRDVLLEEAIRRLGSGS
jgi:carboxyl-terminal processing protease